ncbi:MAG: hypothetical protein DM484_07525 [Candidatus Methylumidiphilus alinenensis]|uniref:Uncharacterized protein n=1 Tax=Candidatus Methylumidiphilus alinenensis TaxID=2202197 RepID=A0A2W4RCN4_9GAMM|nr:MAG: hypothetical protein DM484_07525 [Candidatus Methylumidiphilus alinenensis]
MGNTHREHLKGYFKLYCAPTESHFAELINGMLNFEDDGIFKSTDGLSIKAVGNPQNLLNFYDNTGSQNPAWKLQLKPTAVQPAATVKPGFSISDGQGPVGSRLFINKTNGYIGIGTGSPKGKLDIADVLYFDLDQSGNKSINFANADGKYGEPAKITYHGVGGTSHLSLVGAGTTGKTISFFDHVNVHGNLAVTKQASIEGGLRVTGSADIQEVLYIGHNGQQTISFVEDGQGIKEAISYKEGKTDYALNLYGAESAKGNTKEIRLYDNVEVSGRLAVKGEVIRKLTVVTRTKDKIEIEKPQASQVVSNRSITFHKSHCDTVIRVIYFDNMEMNGQSYFGPREIRLILFVDGKESPKIIKKWHSNMLKGFSTPVFMYGYLEGMNEIKDYTIKLKMEIPKGYHIIDSVSFGLDSAQWTMEVQEVLLPKT